MALLFVACQRLVADDWKSQIQLPSDPLLSEAGLQAGDTSVHWVKFLILTNAPDQVVFQDSRRYLLHYDFATNWLDAFKGMSRAAFDEISMRRTNQQVVLGAVLVPQRAGDSNVLSRLGYGIQFVGHDPYPPEMVADLFALVRPAIDVDPLVQAYYIPSYEQQPAADLNSSYFQSRGIRLGSIDQWTGKANAWYSRGWAMGRLKCVLATEIAAAYADGRLRPEDILLTDAVPAELPRLAGILTLSPGFPNSHVAILAQAEAVPFVYVADETDRKQLLSLVGREIAFPLTSRMALLIEDLDPSVKQEIAGLKTPVAITIPPKAQLGRLSADAKDLVPSDAKYFGGKAANYGLLLRTFPEHTPDAIAFSFDFTWINQ